MKRLYHFEWSNGDGHIGTAKASSLAEAKKVLWKDLQEQRHHAVMKDLKRGKRYTVSTIPLPKEYR